jgi:hypothetical protein
VTDWLAEQFAANRDNGAAAFFLHNSTVADATEATARAFLGVQLQCVQCHDHPFTALRQDDYWGMAAFYVKLNKYVQKRGSSDIAETDGSRGLWEPPEGFQNLPPRFLGGAAPKLETGAPYRPHLADWLTSPENPYFARAMVNRTWAHYFARGLVHPVDGASSTQHDGRSSGSRGMRISDCRLMGVLTAVMQAGGAEAHHEVTK